MFLHKSYALKAFEVSIKLLEPLKNFICALCGQLDLSNESLGASLKMKWDRVNAEKAIQNMLVENSSD